MDLSKILSESFEIRNNELKKDFIRFSPRNLGVGGGARNKMAVGFLNNELTMNMQIDGNGTGS